MVSPSFQHPNQSQTWISIDGRIYEPGQLEAAKISVFDRSFLYGDSLYEVAGTRGGRPHALEPHYDRLWHSASLAHIQISQTREELTQQIEAVLARFRDSQPTLEAYIRIVISRGEGLFPGFGTKTLPPRTTVTLYVQALQSPTQEAFEKGLHLACVPRLRNSARALDPAMKSGNYLNSLLAMLEAEKMGANDAILLNSDGHVTEGTTFNVGYFKRGILVTSPLDIGILDGITRREVIALAHARRIEVREVRFPLQRLYEADEVFVTSTVRGLFPVTRLDQRVIGNGKPGTLTRMLSEMWTDSSSDEITARAARRNSTGG